MWENKVITETVSGGTILVPETTTTASGHEITTYISQTFADYIIEKTVSVSKEVFTDAFELIKKPVVSTSGEFIRWDEKREPVFETVTLSREIIAKDLSGDPLYESITKPFYDIRYIQVSASG